MKKGSYDYEYTNAGEFDFDDDQPDQSVKVEDDSISFFSIFGQT